MKPFSFLLQNYLNQTNAFYRFLLVGVLNTLVGLSVIFVLLHVFNLNYWVSTFSGNGLGAIVGYFLNRKFTFNSKISHRTGITSYMLVIFVCYIGSFSISEKLALLTHSFFLFPFIHPHDVAVFFGMVIYTGSNYIGQRLIVFRIRDVSPNN